MTDNNSGSEGKAPAGGKRAAKIPITKLPKKVIIRKSVVSRRAERRKGR
jgi:hypothetical protein